MYFNNANPPVLQKNEDNSLADKFLVGKDYIEFLQEIQDQRIKSLGNYDAIFGKVTNFHWSFQPDGSYDIILDLISAGDVIESFKMNSLPTFNTPTPPSKLDGILPKNIIANKNKHILGQILYELTREIYNNSTMLGPGFKYFHSEKLSGDVDINGKQIQNIKSFGLEAEPTGITHEPNQSGEMFYIRLGSLLNIIQENVVYKLKGADPNSPKRPILKFDYRTEDNLMNLLVEDYDPNLSKLQDPSGNFSSVYSFYPCEHVMHQVSYDPFICVAFQQFQNIDRDFTHKDTLSLLQQTVNGNPKEGTWTIDPYDIAQNSNISTFEVKKIGRAHV